MTLNKEELTAITKEKLSLEWKQDTDSQVLKNSEEVILEWDKGNMIIAVHGVRRKDVLYRWGGMLIACSKIRLRWD